MMTFSTFHKIFINVISNIVHRSFKLISVPCGCATISAGVSIAHVRSVRERKKATDPAQEKHGAANLGWSAVKCSFTHSFLYLAFVAGVCCCRRRRRLAAFMLFLIKLLGLCTINCYLSN